ncbi:hypothetical protein F5146DRAFT_660442 [Armillaria mellea]|nr:hypothetical protein F5146DRAFT_660442 [Armillaria mellea]
MVEITLAHSRTATMDPSHRRPILFYVLCFSIVNLFLATQQSSGTFPTYQPADDLQLLQHINVDAHLHRRFFGRFDHHVGMSSSVGYINIGLVAYLYGMRIGVRTR